VRVGGVFGTVQTSVGLDLAGLFVEFVRKLERAEEHPGAIGNVTPKRLEFRQARINRCVGRLPGGIIREDRFQGPCFLNRHVSASRHGERRSHQ
jgi:hypothetical protein